MADLTYYVDPDAVGVGDGSSWADAYTSLEACEQAQKVIDHTADDLTFECRSSSGTADTTQLSIGTWTFGWPLSLLIKATAGHEAVATGIDTNRYRITSADDNGTIELLAAAGIVTLSRLQVICTDAISSGSCIYVITTSECLVDRCYMEVDSAGGNQVSGLWVNAGGAARAVNCISWDKQGGNSGNGFYCDNGTLEVDNCVAYNHGDGMECDAGTMTIRNSASFGSSSADFDNTATMTVTYSASDDTQSGTGNIDSLTWTDVFTDHVNGDFSLKVTDTDLTDAADELHAEFTTSMNDVDRGSANWDIGPYQSGVAVENTTIFVPTGPIR